MSSTMMISDDATALDRPIDVEQPGEQGRGPEDGSEDASRDAGSGKRKFVDREPESPGKEQGSDGMDPPFPKKERAFYEEMGEESPASYPKHVIVPTDETLRQKEELGGNENPDAHEQHPQPAAYTSPPSDKPGHMLTPDSAGTGPRQNSHGYDPPPSYPRHQPYHDVYRAPSYNPEMDYGRSSYGNGSYQQGGGSSGSTAGGSGESYSRPPRRWACDYCNVATFLSYEEACAHEEACARRHHDNPPYHDQHHQPSRPPAAYGGRPPPPPGHHTQHNQGGGSGLGALYHASQEVVTPPTPHHQSPNQWSSHRGPPLPVLPHEQSYYRQGYYDRREDSGSYQHSEPYYPAPQSGHPHYHHHGGQQPYQKRMLLAMASDKDSLSDRQCYVRSEMVEIFAANEKDVAARHSKGAQKLALGQVGIRCVHCSHLRPRDRAERAVCYPSSISRIYQTVADMQRFHFEQCREIPDHVRQLYKKLKTTRPRGVGSPQTYWISSAKTIGLADTENGIRFDTDLAKEQQQFRQQNSTENMSVSTP